MLRFSPTAWAKLLHFRDRGQTEIGGFGISKPDDLLFVHDFLTVKQEVTVASVSFDDNAVADFFEDQVDAGRKPEQFGRIWLHIGVGAIGRQVALQLAAMGIPWLQLIDFDTVEESNLASQGYLEDDLSGPKVQATADLCQQINHQLEVLEINERFRRSMEIGNVIFCAVDKIDVRRLIWESVKDRSSFFCDGRMSAEVLRVLTACDTARGGKQDGRDFNQDTHPGVR